MEVLAYRVGINVAAAASVVSSLAVFLPHDNPVQQVVYANLDALALAGALGLGVSLTQIHIYVDPLKKALQALWLLGLAGTLGLMVAQDPPAAAYVAANPLAVWLIGPMFAALTGVAFKEGLCYGKAEAAGLFGATPLFLLGHLSGVVSQEGERGLLAAFAILFSVFALRKWTQAVKDDVGDKSVFEFIKLAPEIQDVKMKEREAREASRRAAAAGGGMDLGRLMDDSDE